MKTIILRALLLALTCAITSPVLAASSPLAELLPVSSSDSGSLVFYLNTRTVHRMSNNQVQAWDLLDYKTPQYDDKGRFYYRSVAVLHEIDCNQRTSGMLSIAWYSDSLGQGQILSSMSFPPEKVVREYVLPHSNADYSLTAACAAASKT